MNPQLRRLRAPLHALLVGLLVLVPASPAAAQETERIQVRPLGGNSTGWVAEDVFVELLSPTDYNDAACCEDNNSGEWDGPQYTATSTGSTDNVSLIYSVSTEAAAQTAEEAVQMSFGHDLPELERGTVVVAHSSNGTVVGDIEAFYIITQCNSPQGCARTEGALAFPIGRGIFATVNFVALIPSSDDGLVGGSVPASDWHHEQIGIALRQVTFISAGSDGDDNLTGTSGADNVQLLGGNDTYNAAAGNDSVYGDAGNDDLAGGAGNDLLDGGANDDELTGGDGGDTLKGGGGNDVLTGDGPNSVARAGTSDGSYRASAGGIDTLLGGGGRDRLIGGAGLDAFNGGPGSDICIVDSKKEKRRVRSCETIRVRRGHL